MDRLAEAINVIKTHERMGREECVVDSTKFLKSVLGMLKSESYIKDFEEFKDGKFIKLKIKLSNRINSIGVVKPRYAVKNDTIQKYESRYIPSKDFGILVLSTPKGLMTNKEARAEEEPAGGWCFMFTSGMKMREIELPEGVKAEVKGPTIAISGKLGTNTRTFNDALVAISVAQGKIMLDHVKDKKLAEKATNAESALFRELSNDILGVGQYFERKMKSVHAHFPITVEAKGQAITINNIIGERAPRMAKIAGATKVEVKGQNLKLYGISLDDVSQTAANVRKACRMRNKDTRVFQDGLYFEVL